MAKHILEQVQHGFVRVEKDGVAWYSAPSLLEAGVLHGLSARGGGVSAAPASLATLNLGWNRPDDAQNVQQNYRRLAQAAGFAYHSMALVRYEHGNAVRYATADDQGRGFAAEAFDAPCDGLIANSPALTMITLHADCLPVFLYAPSTHTGAMLHAGWKGVVLGIGTQALSRMTQQLDCRAGEMLAAIGPGISRRRFEVDLPVVARFEQAALRWPDAQKEHWLDGPDERNKYFIDLPQLMAAQLTACGIPAGQITLADHCTYDNPQDFYSYRRDGKACGAMAGFLRVPEETHR